jgi:eukaryotic-like serine/threonine-protein kinase
MSSSHRKNKNFPAWIIILLALVAILLFDIWGLSGLAARLGPILSQHATETHTYTSTPAATEIRAPTFTVTPTPGIGSTWTSPVEGMVMVYIPQGEFSMGNDNGDADEAPMHSISLDAYWIDQTEVTNAMYAKCTQTGVCQPPSQSFSQAHNAYYSNLQYADYPVIYVNWNEAQSYCKWVGGRLPTEAEWEKAARGTDGRKYPWGNDTPTCSLADFWSGNSGCVGDTTVVGSYPTGASLYGALDMAGNVWEWVADWYDAAYYSNSPAFNPPGPPAGDNRVLRGGSWGDTGDYLSTSIRLRYDPAFSLDYVGFRCARSLP